MTEAKSIVAAEFLQQRDQCTAAAIELVDKKDVNVKTLTELRTRFGDGLASLIAETASLQKKAKRKFGEFPACVSGVEPGVWWATRRSLQQATPWQVARLKSSWLGRAAVCDLCCAVGGDSISLAARGNIIAVDRDPILVAMAQANLTTAMPNHSSTNQSWQTQCDDVVRFQIPEHCSIHIDPDRRTEKGTGSKKGAATRGIRAEEFSPTWTEVCQLISRSNSAIVKLAPATGLDWQPPDRPTHRCWISLQGTVREQSLLIGEAVNAAGVVDRGRSAYRLAADGSWNRFASGQETDRRIITTSQPETWLIDPASSIRAAGLTESFAAEHSLKSLGGPSGFLTSGADELPEEVTGMATTGKVVWSGSANDRKLKRELRAHGWFAETVKCRSVDRDPADLFRRFRDCGDVPVTLWIGRVGKKVYAAITELGRDSTE